MMSFLCGLRLYSAVGYQWFLLSFCSWGIANLTFAQSSIPKTKVALLLSSQGVEQTVSHEVKRGVEVFQVAHPELFQLIKLKMVDTRGSLEQASSLVTNLKEQDFSYVIGLRNGEEALWVAQFAEVNPMLFLSPLSTYSKVTLGKKNSFQIAANEVLQGAALARFSEIDLERKKILILVNDRSVYSQAFAESFIKAIQLKAQIHTEIHHSNGTELRIEELESKLNKFKPDLIVICDELTRSSVLAKYIHKKDPSMPFLTGDIFGNEKAVKSLLKEVPNIRIFYSSLWSGREKTEENRLFKKHYRELWKNDNPSQEAALTFDAFLILTRSLKLSGNSRDLDRVRYFLERTTFETTQGKLDFMSSPTHSPIKNVHIKVTNAKIHKHVKTLRTQWKEKR